jgi:soluble lytic murein transglycosylase-like protein
MTMLLQSAAAPASADVLEIGADGAVRVRGGGADVTWVDATGVDARGVDATEEEAGTGAKVALAVPAGALTSIAAPIMPDSWRAPLETAAARYRVSPTLLAALVWQESRWHPAAVSAKGAVGLTQLMPSTARALTVDARDPAANLDGGAHYLRQMLDLFDGDVERALAAYNAGPGRVLRAGGLPAIAETRAYVSTIIDRLTPDLATGRP